MRIQCNAPLLEGVIYCEAKIALSNSLAAIAAFLLACHRGIYGDFLSFFLSPFCLPELRTFTVVLV
jgi:hypothetical protein